MTVTEIACDPLFDVSGRVVVLTGARGLIGGALTAALHNRGARVAAVDLEGTNADSQSDEDEFYACDVSSAKDVQALAEAVVGRFGSVDVLVNAHQYKPRGFLEAKAESFPEELWDDVLNVNLKGTFLTCREFGRLMLSRGQGSIINLASTYGVVSSNPALYADNSLGNPLAYSASKGGVIMLTKYLGVNWAGQGVRVNAVTPHGVWNHHEEAFEKRFSQMSPMGRLSQVDEVVGAVIYLASDASSYVTGTNLLVEGGWTAW